jgi:hypothetical protein
LAPRLKGFARAEAFRKAVEMLPGADMDLDEAFAALARLSDQHGMDGTSAAKLAAIARGVLPIRRDVSSAEAETRFIYALATLVDPALVERPTSEAVSLALIGLKAERLGQVAGLRPALPVSPMDVLVAELAHAFRSIDNGSSRLKSRMTMVEIIDARFTYAPTSKALTLILRDPAVTRDLADEALAGVLMTLIGTADFLHEEIGEDEMPSLLGLAERLLKQRGIDMSVTAELCRIHVELTVKRAWASRASAIRRTRRYGKHCKQRSA